MGKHEVRKLQYLCISVKSKSSDTYWNETDQYIFSMEKKDALACIDMNLLGQTRLYCQTIHKYDK